MQSKSLIKTKNDMMNRRAALKNLTLSIGYVISAPTIMSVLSSCTEDTITWKPLFLSEPEKHMVTHLVDIILPSSDLPGGLDVNIPQFIDIMYQDTETDLKKKQFQNGANIFANKFVEMFGKKVVKGKKEDIQKLFSTYFDLSDKKTQQILKEQKLTIDELSDDKKDLYLMYKFLFSVRYYTLYGYYTSEKVGEEVLNYDPVPGAFKGCIPLKEIGNAWSL